MELLSDPKYSIFFDDGGVINDNERRGPQWLKLIADYYVPRYGFTSEQWKEANVEYLSNEIAIYDNLLENNILHDFKQLQDDADERWIIEMFQNLGIPVPNRNECIRLTREAASWIIPQIHASYPGMNVLVRKLANHFDLYTSSGEHFDMLKGYFRSQGIDHCFKQLYGSDIVGVFKSHPEYFKRIFDETGVNPEYSIVIDDKSRVLDLAGQFGAIGIQSNLPRKLQGEGNYPIFNSPDELESLITKITGIKL